LLHQILKNIHQHAPAPELLLLYQLHCRSGKCCLWFNVITTIKSQQKLCIKPFGRIIRRAFLFTPPQTYLMSILNLNTKPTHTSRISVDLNTVEALRMIAAQFPGRALLETNFTLEDQVLTHLIFQYDIPIRVFTRSGRDQYEILKDTIDHYGKAIEVSFFQAELASQSFADNNAEQVLVWQTKPEIAPLNYVLQSKHVLLSSHRKERLEATPLKWDEAREKFIFSPLVYWTDIQIYAFILENNIPHAPASIPGLAQSDATAADAVSGWSTSFRKYLPQYSVVSGSFNLVHQIATFFRLPQVAPHYAPLGN